MKHKWVIAVKDGHDSSGGVTLADAVPVGATAVSYNVTVAGPTGPNFVAITPGDATAFTASAINFDGSSDVANAGIVSIDTNRTVKVWNGDQSGTTHVIIDITGYFVKPMFAEVAANATLTNGSRVVSVTSAGTGLYDVRFDRNVVNCAYAATIGGESLPQFGGVIDTLRPAADTVRVATQDTTPALADRAFDLVVTC